MPAVLLKGSIEGNSSSAEESDRKKRVEALMANFTNDSAFMIAFERDLESKRADALFQDPLAKYLVGPVDSESNLSKGAQLSEAFGKKSAAQFGFAGWDEFHTQWTACRTKFIDDEIAKAVAADPSGEKTQFVNIGAGFDTRAYRLKCFEGIGISFEVDMESVNEMKQTVFDALCKNQDTWKPICGDAKNVTCDLMLEGDLEKKLKSSGFEASKNSIFIAEGLIMYLGVRQIPFLEEVSTIAGPGSTLILNFMSMSAEDIEKLRISLGDAAADAAAKMAPSKGEVENTLAAGGFTDISIFHWGESALNYGRFPVDKFSPSHGWSFAVAKKA